MAEERAYVTEQGDTWDLISFYMYGSERFMKYLIEANWEYLDFLVFPSGIEIIVPEIPDDVDENAPFWRQDDSSDDDDEDETYSSVEDDEEGGEDE